MPTPDIPANEETITVVAVDDHKAILQGLSMLFENEDDIHLCATAVDGASGLAAIATYQPDVVILDLSLQQSNGLDVLKDIKIQFPDTEILVLTMHNETVYADRAIKAGALGFIMKDESLDKVVEGVREVHNKNLFVSEKMKTQMLRQSIGQVSSISTMPISKLSDRELEVFTLIGSGKRPRHISEQLNMSPKTVASYCSRIREKLDLGNMDDLISLASDWVKTEN